MRSCHLCNRHICDGCNSKSTTSRRHFMSFMETKSEDHDICKICYVGKARMGSMQYEDIEGECICCAGKIEALKDVRNVRLTPALALRNIKQGRPHMQQSEDVYCYFNVTIFNRGVFVPPP